MDDFLDEAYQSINQLEIKRIKIERMRERESAICTKSKSHCLSVCARSTCKKANTNEQSNIICTGIDRLTMSIYQGFSFSLAFAAVACIPSNVRMFRFVLFSPSNTIGQCYCFDFLAIKISFHNCEQIM